MGCYNGRVFTEIPFLYDINVEATLKATYPYLEPCFLRLEGPDLRSAVSLGEVHAPGFLGFTLAYPAQSSEPGVLVKSADLHIRRVLVCQAYPLPESGVRYGDDGLARVIGAGDVRVKLEPRGDMLLSWRGATGFISNLRVSQLRDESLNTVWNRLEGFLSEQGCREVNVAPASSSYARNRQTSFLRARGYRLTPAGHMSLS